MKDILKLLETVARRKKLGTLLLGRGRERSEIFLEENLIYLAGETFAKKIDLEGLVETGALGKMVSEATLDTFVMGTDLSRTILPEVLLSRGLVDQKHFDELARLHLREEILARLVGHLNTFQFQDGHIPEGLIGRDSVTVRMPTPLDEFLEFSRRRLEELTSVRKLIPSHDEVFIITEKGMAQKQGGQLDFGLRKILDLLDGFRTLGSIVEDGILFGVYVERQVAAALESGWIKKTLLPEIHSIDPSRLNMEEGQRYLPFFKNAIRHGADELKARENYATLAERLGKNDEAVVQYNYIGDTLYKMGRKALSVRAYRKGLSLNKDDPLITEKIVRVYRENAEEALRQKAPDEARTQYRHALQVYPGHPEILRALVDLHTLGRETSDIADLCDQAAAQARTQKDPASAIELLQKVIATFHKEPTFYKKLINLYLDFDMSREAADQMEKLANLYVETGQESRGLDLIDKILRLDPSRKHLRKIGRPSSRPPRPRTRVSIGRALLTNAILLALLVMTAYQLWTYRAFRGLQKQEYLAEAATAAKNPELDIIESRLELKLRRLAKDAEKFQRDYPLSIFGLRAERLRGEFMQSAIQFERARNHVKKKILEDGLALFEEQKNAEAVSKLERLLALDESDPWRRQATEAMRKYRDYEGNARVLRQQAEDETRKGNFREAHRLLDRLLSRYPRARAAVGVKLPVEVTIIPLAASQGAQGVPRLVHLPPRRTLELELNPPGFEPRKVQIRAVLGASQVFYLNQTPAWSVTLPPPGDYPIQVHRGRVIHLDATGNVHVLQEASGKVLWKYETPPLIGPNAPVKVLDSQLYLALNNSQIMRFHLLGRVEEVVSIAVDGFVQTPLVAAGGDGSLYFGTSRNTIVKLDTRRNVLAGRIEIPETPANLLACGPRALIFVAVSGTVYRLDLETGKLTWVSRLRETMVSGPVLLGKPADGNLLFRNEKSEVIALEVTGGEIHWRLEPSAMATTRSTAFLPQTRRILVAEGSHSILEIDPRTRSRIGEFRTDNVRLPFVRLVELPEELGLFAEDGSFHRVDPETLVSKWRFHRQGRRLRSVAVGDSHLVLMDHRGTLFAFERGR